MGAKAVKRKAKEKEKSSNVVDLTGHSYGRHNEEQNKSCRRSCTCQAGPQQVEGKRSNFKSFTRILLVCSMHNYNFLKPCVTK